MKTPVVRISSFMLALGMTVGIASQADAVAITNLHNTGVTAGSGFTGGGISTDLTTDAYYTVTGPGSPVATVRSTAFSTPVDDSYWFIGGSSSAWIAPSAGATGAGGSYTYEATFTTPGSGSVLIKGSTSASSSLTSILVDGNPLLFAATNPLGFTLFNAANTSVVVGGTSHAISFTLNYNVEDEYTGLRVEFSTADFTASLTPEPSSLTLLGVGGVAALARYRRRRKT